MPTYDYQCRSCGHTAEVIHSMLEDGPTTCERCGGALRRILYPTGIIFRGSGFYKTDSRSKGGSSTATSSSESNPKAAATESRDAGKPADSGTAKPASSSGGSSDASPASGGAKAE